MKEIHIDPNSILVIIQMFKDVSRDFKLISYTGSDNKKICSFAMSGNLCKIEIYIKKTSVRLVPMNKSISEEKALIDYIAARGFSANTPTKIVTLKSTKKILESLLEHIIQEYEGKISYSIDRNIYRFVGYNRDYLTLTFHEKGTMVMQGRPYYVFNAILLFLSTIPEFSIEKIYDISSEMIGDSTPFKVIRDLMDFKLGTSIEYLDEPLLKGISGALSQQNQSNLSEEFVGCLAGIFKALEGYLYKTLTQRFSYKLKERNSFVMFKQDNEGIYEIEKNLGIEKEDKQQLIKLYEIYKKYRHVYLHSTVDPVHTRIIESRKEAVEISDFILDAIKESYNIFTR